MESSRLLEQGPEGWESDWEEMEWVLHQAPAPVAYSQGCVHMRDPRAPSMEGQCGWESPGELCAAVLWGAEGLIVSSKQVSREPRSTWQSWGVELRVSVLE